MKIDIVSSKRWFDTFQLTDYELCIAADLVDPLSMVTTWADIGGLEETVQEMRETVIVPFQKRSLFKGSTLLRAPKGLFHILHSREKGALFSDPQKNHVHPHWSQLCVDCRSPPVRPAGLW